MLSNFNLSEGLTTATASAFYIRQLSHFHWLWIVLMESVVFGFSPGRWRTAERAKEGGGRELDVEGDRWDCSSNWCRNSIQLIKYRFLHL